MANKIPISVVMPAYNSEKYIAKAIESVLNQTFTNFELIIINDGSTDDTEDIIKKYAKKDSRIKFIAQTNKGLSAVRNLGIDLATGEFISFIDSDDTIDNNYLETLLNLQISNDADIVVAAMQTVYNNKISEKTLKKNITTDKFAKKISLFPNGSCCNKIFKRKLFITNNLRFPIGRFYEDNIVLVKLAYLSNKIVFTNSVSYYYHIHNDGITGNSDALHVKKANEDRLAITKEIMDYCTNHKKLNRKELYEIKKFLIRTIAGEFIHKHSNYFKQIQNILGRQFVSIYKTRNFVYRIFNNKG